MDLLFVFLPLAVVIVLLAFQPGRSASREKMRLAAIERKLQLVMDHLGIVEPEPDMPEVVRALEHDHKIAAVKAYREATGASLSDAKNAVDAMAKQRGL